MKERHTVYIFHRKVHINHAVDTTIVDLQKNNYLMGDIYCVTRTFIQQSLTYNLAQDDQHQSRHFIKVHSPFRYPQISVLPSFEYPNMRSTKIIGTSEIL